VEPEKYSLEEISEKKIISAFTQRRICGNPQHSNKKEKKNDKILSGTLK